ncbi:hypothetical protein C8A03DRAFT_38669 [Achaetomium macrosporum]|uniref:Short-chain dehydrogenase/reductase n=1 Tax=Achaetomium macrosporum TaxID=79813 RepID=A0AAN7H712_9PEZI|nr:hypothetical protein C8A03DRAFT_38669 [Achaetomium macrosporum]
MHWLLAQFLVRPPYPTASFEGKTIVITGSNTGLGKEAARHYVRLGAGRVILAVRNLDKGHEAKYDIEATTWCAKDVIQVWHLDMASYASVRKFASRAAANLDRIDIFHANAGLAAGSRIQAEGNDAVITVNFISTILMAALLMPKLKDTAAKFATRPVFCVTSSVAHAFTKFKQKAAPEGDILAAIEKQAKEDTSPASREDLYSISKLLAIFAVRSIAEKCPAPALPVTVNLVDPGLCWSELARDFDGLGNRVFMTLLARSTEVGSRTLLHAGAQGADSHGGYLSSCQPTTPSAVVAGPGGKDLQERVWRELVGKLDAIVPGVTSNFS